MKKLYYLIALLVLLGCKKDDEVPVTSFTRIYDHSNYNVDYRPLEVEAGQTVAIIFENVDFMQHNLLIAKPGTLETVGAAADKMAADANGAEKSYIPDVPELLYSTRLVNPGEKVVLTFTAPSEPGDYPYLCTFPGHWRIMNGILKVTNGKSAD